MTVTVKLDSCTAGFLCFQHSLPKGPGQPVTPSGGGERRQSSSPSLHTQALGSAYAAASLEARPAPSAEQVVMSPPAGTAPAHSGFGRART